MPPPPNIIVVLSDDHAAWAAGCYGDRVVATPNLNRLATEGCQAQQAFTPSPVCSPARACLFTGRLPSQHGIHDWLLERPDAPRDWLTDEINLAQILRARGYRTGLIGKWHCGNSWAPKPGFDFWLSYSAGQYPHGGNIRLSRNGQAETHKGDQAVLLTDQAIAFLQEDDPRPVFLVLGMVDTHSPFTDHPEDLVEHYRKSAHDDLPHESTTHPGWTKFGVPANESRRREWAAQYYAAVSVIDHQVGRLLSALETDGKLDETLVIYTSDHGHMNGHHGLYTKGNATVPQNFYEESIRVPLLLRHPATIPGGIQINSPVDHCDLFQTICDFAGADLPTDRRYPGASFRPLLAESDAPWRSSQFCEYGNARMIRQSGWKLIVRYAPHDIDYGDELYNLTADPRETRNLIADAQHASLAARLRAELEVHFARHEEIARSGRDIMSQPVHNPGEPWRLIRPEITPPEGTDWRVLDNYPHP